MDIVTFKIPANTTGALTAKFNSWLENEPPIESDFIWGLDVGTGTDEQRSILVKIPEDVATRPGKTFWSAELNVDGNTIDTEIVEINNDPGALLERRTVQQNAIALQFLQDLIAGTVVAASPTEAHVFGHDGTLLQKITVVDGNRTPGLSRHSIAWFGDRATLDVTATMLTDNGVQQCSKEITQEGIIQ